MGQNQDTSFDKQFLKHLRFALNHLYDPDQLRQSPLGAFFHVEGHFDTPSAIQRILTRAIESFRCAPNSPTYIHNQRIYELLLYRYVQHISQEEYAHQLGVSVRQFRREQNQAIYELGHVLWQEYGKGAAMPYGNAPPELEADESEPTTDLAADSDHSDELTWLKNMSPEKTTDLPRAIDSVMELIAPLANQKGITIRHDAVGHTLLAVHPVAFQQVLLSMLSYAIEHISDALEPIQMAFTPREQTLDITVIFPVNRKPNGIAQIKDVDAGLRVMHNILELSGGLLELSTTARHDKLRVTFSTVKPRTVLVIEDNEEIVALMQRYVVNMNYTLTPVRNPARAVQEALEMRPNLIIVDIMMPQIDGLEVLSRIKRQRELEGIPVIVCSVLPQQELALALGAADFLQKPIHRDALIACLERHSTV